MEIEKNERKDNKGVQEKTKEAELQTKSWRYLQWLQNYALHTGTCLDYFKHSDFYDKECVNEILARQQANPEARKQLSGYKEYFVDDHKVNPRHPQFKTPPNPNYMVIYQGIRQNENIEKEKVYYIRGHGDERGVVFPMPILEDLITNRWRTSVHHFNEAFSCFQKLYKLQQEKKRKQREKEAQKREEQKLRIRKWKENPQQARKDLELLENSGNKAETSEILNDYMENTDLLLKELVLKEHQERSFQQN